MKILLEEVLTASTKIKKKEDLLPFKNKYVVYLLIFPNEKAYCGYSSNIERRWSRNYSEYKDCPAVYAALKKYSGQEQKYIVSSFDNTIEALQLEKDLIEHLNLLDHTQGYNLVPGGGDPPHGLQYITPEGYKKMQENGKRLADEIWNNPDKRKYVIQRMREENHKAKMAMTTEQRKESYGKHNIGRIPSNAKPIYQIDLKTQQIINQYSSARKAAESLGDAHYSANIRSVANHKRNSAYGYSWRWVNE